MLTIKQTTAHVPAANRFDYWQDTIFRSVDLSLRTKRAAFRCERFLSVMPRGTAVVTTASPFTLERQRRHMVRDDIDHIAIATLLEGSAFHEQNGHPARVEAGDLVLCDFAKPFLGTLFGPYREARLYVNRSHFESRVGPIDVLAGLTLARSAPLVQMLTTYLASYVTSVPSLSSADAATGLDGVLHLLSGVVENARARPAEPRRQDLSNAVVFSLAEAFVDKHLGDTDLNADRIVRAIGVSRTRLYEAFAEHGGVGAWIRNARLDRVQASLCDPADMRTIERIARVNGFRDYPAFYRAFHRRFGLSPRDSRLAADEC